MKFVLLLMALCTVTVSLAQNNLTIKIIRAEDRLPLEAATVSIPSLKKNSISDTAGIAIFNDLPKGKFRLLITYAGYEEVSKVVEVPSNIEIEMEEEEEEEEIIVQSTRTSRNIRNVPTRVETIELEEIDEKSNMRPGNVSMLLHESTGIQVQQTSATSGAASIRIQGLDGRYTQLLKDGFAAFGNFASGLSVLEIPPLDLKQVEIIKGPASTLYGGGAIAGVVNFISKTPSLNPEYNIVLNQSNIGQSNVGFFSSKRNKKVGYTFLGLFSNQKLYDVDKDDFTEVPEAVEFVIHPKLFVYPNEYNTFILGNSFTKGDRTGGDVQVLRNKGDNFHQYYEENNTIRNVTTFEWQHKKVADRSFTLKQSISLFDRHIRVPVSHFHGTSINSFTDLSWLINRDKHSIVAGANLIYDNFKEKDNSLPRDNRNMTGGIFLQDTWDASEKVKLESGLRLDLTNFRTLVDSHTEFFALPRISLLYRYNDKLSSRIGVGLGYKLPSMFTERAEGLQYRSIQQLGGVRSERSYGGTADLNYKTRIGSDFDFSFNQMFFYTWLNFPVVLQEDIAATFKFVNADDPVITMGFETNAKLIFRRNLKLFLGYTFTNAEAKYLPGNQFLPLVPKHKFNSALIYEKHEFIKVGLEGYYTSPQFLYNGSKTPDYWEFGFMVEKLFKKFSLYINFENFTDTRQSKFDRVANDPHPTPSFDDIWTHTEGFVINGGIKLRL